MGVVIVLMGFLHGTAGGKEAGFLVRLKQSLPPFVLAFLGMALLRTFGVLRRRRRRARHRPGGALLEPVAKWAILGALAAVGLATRASHLAGGRTAALLRRPGHRARRGPGQPAPDLPFRAGGLTRRVRP